MNHNRGLSITFLLFIASGLVSGVLTAAGFFFAEFTGFWSPGSLEGALPGLMVINGFVVIPATATLILFYYGFKTEDRVITTIASSLSGYVGYFLYTIAFTAALNIAAPVTALQASNTASMLGTVVALENSIGYLGFPTLLVSMASGLFGQRIREA